MNTDHEEEERFCIVNTQTGERMTDENGRVHLFSSKQAQAMTLNDHIPMSWWATREFKKLGEQK